MATTTATATATATTGVSFIQGIFPRRMTSRSRLPKTLLELSKDPHHLECAHWHIMNMQSQQDSDCPTQRNNHHASHEKDYDASDTFDEYTLPEDEDEEYTLPEECTLEEITIYTTNTHHSIHNHTNNNTKMHKELQVQELPNGENMDTQQQQQHRMKTPPRRTPRRGGRRRRNELPLMVESTHRLAYMDHNQPQVQTDENDETDELHELSPPPSPPPLLLLSQQQQQHDPTTFTEQDTVILEEIWEEFSYDCHSPSPPGRWLGGSFPLRARTLSAASSITWLEGPDVMEEILGDDDDYDNSDDDYDSNNNDNDNKPPWETRTV